MELAPQNHSVKLETKQQESDFSKIQCQDQLEIGSQQRNFVQGKWSDDENIKFVVFIIAKKDIFKSKEKRKAERIFKDLSAYIGTRTSRQCRSHFQKMMKKHKTLMKMKKFYREKTGLMEFDQLITQVREQNKSSVEPLRLMDASSGQSINMSIQTEAACYNQLMIQSYNQWNSLPYYPGCWYFLMFN